MSKKLEGNGRWESSRMFLPEHREQHNERGKPNGNHSKFPTAEEMENIRQYILLPIMMTIVENNCRTIETSQYPLKKLYVVASQVLINLLHQDLVFTRKKLREGNIKVFEEGEVDTALHYRFICRGYEDKFAMMRDLVRAEINIRFSHYISKIFGSPIFED